MSLVIALAALVLLEQPAALAVRLVLLGAGLSAIAIMGYAQFRGGIGWSIGSQYRTAMGKRPGDPENDRRPSDTEERAASRELRRGTISRADYERVMARRRFVHGEIDRAQYRQVLAEIAHGEAALARAGGPLRSQPPKAP